MSQKILVVDDEQATVRLLEVILRRAGYDVLMALDGPSALEIAEAEHPGVIVLDVMMPGMSGEEVVRQLRQHPDIADTSVLMLSARAQVENRVSGLRAGADDYLSKPANPEELVARVEALLARASRGGIVAEKEPGRVLLFVGAKGGVGATVSAVNVAVSLALRGLTTDLLDLHWQAGNAVDLLGLRPRSSLADLLRRDAAELNARLVQKVMLPHHSGLNVLSGAPGFDVELLPSVDHLSRIVELAAAESEFVVIDAPPDALCLGAVAPLSDFVALVLTTEPEAVAGATVLARYLRSLGLVAQSIGLVLVHRWPQATDAPLDTISGQVGCDFVGAIQPGLEACREAVRAGVPLVLRNQAELAASSLVRLATRLSRVHIPFTAYKPLETNEPSLSASDLRRTLIRS